jgi:heme a synthase
MIEHIMSVSSSASTTVMLLKRGLPWIITKTTAENGHAALPNYYAATGQWILGTAGLVVGMIHVGGVTRLTQSGLSMTTWSPLGEAGGFLQPLWWSLDEWQAEFDRYKTFPEWSQRKNMTLSDFQYIYAWEYGHRMLGRLVGVAFCVPWLYFSMRRQIPAGYQKRMLGLCAMGATQGLGERRDDFFFKNLMCFLKTTTRLHNLTRYFLVLAAGGKVGWWMVQSGLGEDRRDDKKEIRVKPVRLATHLTLAVATYGCLLWTAFDIFTLAHTQERIVEQVKLAISSTNSSSSGIHALRQAARLRTMSLALMGLTAITITSGALVAGNDAGRAFNTWPKMDGEWIPASILELSPWYRNSLENTATVQWTHRMLGQGTAAVAVYLAWAGLLRRPPLVLLTPQARTGLYTVAIAATGQVTLGVVTLLNYVPLSLAAAHQLGSIVVFTSSLYLAHSLRYARPTILRAVTVTATTPRPSSISMAAGVPAAPTIR